MLDICAHSYGIKVCQTLSTTKCEIFWRPAKLTSLHIRCLSFQHTNTTLSSPFRSYHSSEERIICFYQDCSRNTVLVCLDFVLELFVIGVLYLFLFSSFCIIFVVWVSLFLVIKRQFRFHGIKIFTKILSEKSKIERILRNICAF